MSVLTLNFAPTSSDAMLDERTAPPDPPTGFDSETAAVRELTSLLFGRQDRDRVHGAWRELIAGKEFSRSVSLSPREQIDLSYDRLRLVNSAVDSPEALACDPVRLAALHEWTGFVDSGMCTLASIHYNLFLGSLIDHDGHRRDLSDYTSLKRVGTFLCTELEHGNNAAALETTASYDRATGGFLLHTPNPGAQKFMPNTSAIGGPKSALVAARLLVDGEDQGVFLFLTPLSNEYGMLPGIRVRLLPDRMGSPVDHCLTSFDQVWLPRKALLEAEHGQLTPEGQLVSSFGNRRKRFLSSIARVTTGKLCMSAAAVGASRMALSVAVRYAYHRHITDSMTGQRTPVAAHRSHHGRLLQALASTYAMTFLHRAAVAGWAGHTGADRADAERLAAVAKGWITWQARDVMIECRERCGAQGLLRPNGLADLQPNAEGSITAEGDNLVIWVKAAAEMLFGYSCAVVEDDGSDDSTAALEDPRFLCNLLASAEAIWQDRARTALRNAPAGNPVARWNETSGFALVMVSTHAELRAAEALLAAAEDSADPLARFLLTGLCRLFLLERLRYHAGDLLVEGRMTAQQVRGLPAAVDAVIAELAPHMLALVDAFDIPEQVLAGVPIATGASIEQSMDDVDPLFAH
ncbi:acyl-CoA dehydrogenase family protein [Streptacidiphilus carbonis]|jgi:acyl-CoA oxidase|uniref:acyl-CoA dehydrogenase family protein n=1 Tax=Streptacidiphilus carbonis TaxID=105422 RepID=UPI000AF45B0D|nr:acyl-CoA dehydrogenase [Streptacidiphilus carbonis]